LLPLYSHGFIGDGVHRPAVNHESSRESKRPKELATAYTSTQMTREVSTCVSKLRKGMRGRKPKVLMWAWTYRKLLS